MIAPKNRNLPFFQPKLYKNTILFILHRNDRKVNSNFRGVKIVKIKLVNFSALWYTVFCIFITMTKGMIA